MLIRALLVLAVAAVLGCDSVGPEPGPPIEVENLGMAVPPDSLLHLTPEEWRFHRPIVEIEGGQGAVLVTGDYVLPMSSTWVVGTAELDEGTLIVTIDYHDTGGQGSLGAPKVAYRATVRSLPPGELNVVVRYNSWSDIRFGGIGVGIKDVLQETVVVQ